MTASAAPADEQPRPGMVVARSGGAAARVAIGILGSRVLGLARQTFTAAFLGASGAADAFNAAFKIPNILQNLFGEGALSASFIPVYARLLAQGDEEEAGRVAGAVLAILGLIVAVLVLIGVLLAPYIIPLIAPGFHGYRRDLTITLTRILFPGAGIFVISAWCLGILNSHRRFLLSYSAPILWNVVMIVALLGFGHRQGQRDLAVTLAWASVVGAAAQFLIQVPSTLSVVRHLRVAFDTTSANVRRVITNFVPAFIGRGVVQVSGYIDQLLSSLLPLGIPATLGYAQTVYMLPVSLFAMSISAAELPEMSRALGTQDEMARALRSRLDEGLKRIAFFVIPSAAAFLAFGDVIASLLFQHGHFSAQDTRYAWGILAGSAVGLLASTLGRLYSSAFYALHDTKTPLRFAVIRVILTTVLGYLFALPLPRLLGIDGHWGAAGLTASAGIAGWVEFTLLRSRLNRRIGQTGLPGRLVAELWGIAVLATGCAWATKLAASGMNRLAGAVIVLGVFGIVYVSAALLSGVGEARQLAVRLRQMR